MYSDKLEIHILELPKLKYSSEMPDEHFKNTLYNWCKFFSIENKEELDAMYGKNDYIDKACDHVKELSSDEEKKLEYDLRFKALSDYNTQISSSYNRGIKQGIQQGIQQGIEQGKFKIIANFYNSGKISLEDAINELNTTKDEFLTQLDEYNNI